MQLAGYVDGFKRGRYVFFVWRSELDILRKIALVFAFACLTGILAQIKIVLPLTPVPITGQTFAVLLGAILLGRVWGGISQAIYVGIGSTLIPWFAGGGGGVTAITGPTGGYLIGFIFAALFLGYFVDKYVWSRGFLSMLVLMLFANFVIIHGLGLLQLYIWTSIANSTSIGIRELLMTGTTPFVIGDLIKVIAAATIARGITPKKSYNC